MATAVSLALAAAATQAQTAPGSQDAGRPQEVQQLSKVRVEADIDEGYKSDSATALKFAPSLLDVPQSVTVVNREFMNSIGATSLTDSLRYVPGITLQSAEGGTIGNNINLNGFSARTDLFLDGFRDRGQYYRDTFDLEQVEALMGASSMLFGRGSTGGVINQATKQANRDPLAESTLSITSHGAVRSTLDVGEPLGDNAAARINAFGQNWQSNRDEMRNKDFGVAPNLRFGIGTPTQITLSALLQHNNDMPDYGVPVAFAGTPAVHTFPAPVLDKDVYFGSTDDRTTQDVTFLSGKIEHGVGENLLLRDQVQYNHYTTDARETAGQTVGTVSATGAFTPLTALTYPLTARDQMVVRLQSHDRVIGDSSLFDQADLQFKFGQGMLRHTLLAGAEIGHDSYSNQAITVGGATCNGGSVALGSGFVACTPLLHPAHLARPVNITSAKGNRVTASADTLAGYVNDTLQIGQHFKVVAGLRQDHYQAELANSLTSATVQAHYSQTVSFTSVRGGLIYQPADNQSYYLSYSTSFNPSLETLTVSNGQQNTPPEKNRSYEAGSKLDLVDGSLSLTGAAYRIEKTNARNQIDTGVFELDGQTRVQGVRLGVAGRITRQWQVSAGYLLMDSEVLNGPPTLAGGVVTAAATTGNALANTPRQTVTLWTTYDITPQWQVGGGANSLSSRYATTANIAQVPGFVRFDAMASYHRRHYDISLNVFNLMDKFYYEQTAGSDGGRSVPGIGRTVLLTGRYRF